MRRDPGLLPLLLGAALLCACAEPEARPGPPPAPAAVEGLPDDMPTLLREIEAAYRGGRFDRGLALVKRALELPDADFSTYDRLGSVYFVLGRSGDALAFWSRALALEQDPERRAALSRSIADTRASLGLPDEGSKAPPPGGGDGPTAAAPPPKPRPLPGPAPGPARRADPKEIDRLYKLGVKYYAAGQYLRATDAFLRVLDLDAANADARKALERLRHESGGKAR